MKLVPYNDYVKVKALGTFNGDVTIVARTADGSNLSAEVTLTLENQVTGITEPFGDAGIVMYPNPANDRIYLEMPEGEAMYTIFSIQGARLSSGVLYEGRNELDVVKLPAGMYTIRVTSGTTSASSNFVIQ